MATFVLIHGAGDVGWYWHLVAPELQRRGYDVVSPDLPCDDDSAGWSEYTDTVVAAIGDRTDLALVAQSLGGYTAPLVCERVPVRLMVLVAPMVPLPGESGDEMWANTRYAEASRESTTAEEPGGGVDDSIATFYHDVPAALAREAMSRGRRQAEAPMSQPWPLQAWPDVPTRVIVCQDDRLFPAAWLREVVRVRLGTTPDEIESGHTPALSRPKELAERLEAFRAGL